MSSKVFDLIDLEKKRQTEGLEMIPSENYASEDVLKALGSILTNKYSEGFPGARYYAGNEVIDQIESYAQELAAKVFFSARAIVQPYSGSPANMEVMLGLLNPGDTVMGMSLDAGGHLTHGAPVSFSGKLFKTVQYGVDSKTGRINYDQVRALAIGHKPKLIWAGISSYPYLISYSPFAKIADEVGAYLVADISHVAGPIAGKILDNPAADAHIMTTTTHKTLRGPRGAMILITHKGLEKDPDLIKKLESAVFPGLQGGPHNHQTAAIAVALEEALSPEFKEYQLQVWNNASVLAKELETETENHLLLLDLSNYGFGLGYQAQIALEMAGVTVNKNVVPGERASNYYPSGIRLGTPALTSRGMKESEMKKIALWIKEVMEVVRGHDLPEKQEERKEFIKGFRKQMTENRTLNRIKEEVREFASKYPVPGI